MNLGKVAAMSLLGALLASAPAFAQTGMRPDQFVKQPWFWSGAQNFLGLVATPVCVLTDAATILSDATVCLTNAARGAGVQAVTLTATRTLGLPANMPSTGGSHILFWITHSGAADGPNFAAGFEFPGSTAPPACNGSTITTNCLSIGTQTDWLECTTIDASHIGCPNLITAMSAPGPLDIAPNATFAYGLRRLRVGYTGSAINVRRSSDNTTQDIGFNSTGDFDCAGFVTFIGGGSGFAHTWYDQSGNGINATQATAANQPQIVCNSVGGRPALQGGGFATKQFLTTAVNSALNFSGNYSVFYELQYTATNDGGGTGGGRGDALETVCHYDASQTFFNGWAADAGDTGRAGQTLVFQSNGAATSTLQQSSAAINDGNPHFTGWTYASGTTTATINTDGLTTTNSSMRTPAAITSNGLYLFASCDLTTDAFFAGQIAEIYGWGTTLSSAVVARLLANNQGYFP